VLVHAATIFLSAFLLFQVQPLIARFILPWFGGSAAVWSAALLFFQLVLPGRIFLRALADPVPEAEAAHGIALPAEGPPRLYRLVRQLHLQT